MKLACLRCKHKKIKCDKGEPICHQCITASAECTYVERRKRPRMAQQRNDVRELNKRLESLEKQLHGQEQTSPSPSQSVEDSIETTPDSRPTSSSAGLPLSRETGQDSWIYRLASDARKNIEKVNTQLPPPIGETPDSSTVDDAMSGLNEALEDLGKLRIRTDENVTRAPALSLTPQEGRECVKIFREMITSMVIPDVFVSHLNLDILEVLPDLVESPYVNIEPAMRVAYYNCLFYGLTKLHGPGNNLSKAAYLKVLEVVPAWLGSATGTDLDGHTAALTAWTAINNFDYQLSWRFHLKSCQYLKQKGIDRLDARPNRTDEDEDKSQALRYLYWHVLQTDLLFRLFYGKPSALRWTVGKVTIYVVWIRFTIMTAELFNVLDKCPPESRGPDVLRQVDDYCSQLEELIHEWDLISQIKAPSQNLVLSWLFADHVMNIYASIIGIKRLVRQSNEGHPVDPVALRAARMVISIILHFNGIEDDNATYFFQMFYLSFISFYPFCAVFSLYEHIVATANPDDCEDDLRALENIGSIMQHACSVHVDIVPLSNTVNALNKVVRSMQDSRRNHSSPQQLGDPMQISTVVNSSLSRSGTQQPKPPQGLDLPLSTVDSFQSMLATPGFDFSGTSFPFLQDFPTNPAGGDVQPVEFIRALENGFVGRNWHETWWDMDGDINANLGDLSATPFSGPTTQ